MSHISVVSEAHQPEVVRALLAYGETLAADDAAVGSLSKDPAVNALLISDRFAFLVGVICDQGIPAERAWATPLELRARLGHLDPARIASEAAAVQAAFQRPPKLHRFVKKVSAWIVSAAARVMREYGGDASRIWSGAPTARELQARLTSFDGIGQKKAAMTVEIAERQLGVRVREMEGSDVAYDIHVRRVFLRSGLARRDDPQEVIAAARRLYPERPGALDVPAWSIGRRWCHPRQPDCPACALSQVCPRLIDRAAVVRSL